MWSLSTIDRSAPIGVFDSGLGGLTVLQALRERLPHERINFLGDSARCPYGPREPKEVKAFVLQICDHLARRGCKMIVIACNTATAAGLPAAQQAFAIPIVGVVMPGARAAVHMTRNRRVGVIATEGTVQQGVYGEAIRHLDAGIRVIQKATPDFVSIAESGFEEMDEGVAQAAPFSSKEERQGVAQRYLAPLRMEGIDTLVLGCTHYPLIQELISQEMGPSVTLVSSAEETAREVHAILSRRDELRSTGEGGGVEVLITGDDATKFARVTQKVLGITPSITKVMLDEAPGMGEVVS